MSGNGHRPPADLAATVAPLRALTLRDLDGFAFPAAEWLVDGLVPAGALVLLVGRPKVGKSLLGVDLSASIALGESFLGRATRQGPVCYVPAEDALPLFRDRLWARLGPERDAPLVVVPVDGSLPQRLRLDDATSFAALAGTVAGHRPRLLVLDPLVELHRRDENSADEMSALLRPLRQLAHETGTAVLLIHHANKHAADPSLAVRGSSAIAGSVDVVVTLRTKSDDADDPDAPGPGPGQAVTLRVEGRYGPRQRLVASLGPHLRWEAGDAAEDDGSAADRVRRYLAATAEALTADELAAATDSTTKTVQNVVTPLVRAGKVVRVGPGTRVAPFRYRAGTIGNQPGTIPMIPPDERGTLGPGGIIGVLDDPPVPCLDCGEPLPPGRSYRCAGCAPVAAS